MFEISVRSGRFPLRWAGVGVLSAIAFLPLDGAVARSYFASSSYLLLSSPLQPRSNEECTALMFKFLEEIGELSSAHNECQVTMNKTGGGLEKCRYLADARDEAEQRSTEQQNICHDRLRRYQEQERREEQARRQQEQERQARAAQRDAASNQRAAQRAARQAEREAEELAEQQRREQEEAQRQTRREERAASRASAAAGTPVRVTVSPPPAKAQKPQKPSSSGKGREQEESDYWALVKKVKETADAGRLAVEAIKNPFATAVGFAANEMNEALLKKGISAATGLPEHHDEGYAGMTAIVDEVRSHIPSKNPFAQQVSSLSLSAVKQVHQGALGELEQVGKQIEVFEPRTAPPGYIFAPSPDPAAARLGNEEPIPEIVTDSIAPTGRGVYSANPFATAASETRYTDVASSTSFRIPAGHTLYRDSSGGNLRVVRLADVRPGAAAGDRPEAGEHSCSADGVGVVTPECERERAKGRNPFTPAASP